MITPEICEAAFGKPMIGREVNVQMQRDHFTLLEMPEDITKENTAIPKRVFCHKLLVDPLLKALRFAIERNCVIMEIKSWDGCFSIRPSRGHTKWSIHSWALAIDINARQNPLGKKPAMSPELVQCFTDAGFDWGGSWHRPDGMHFQLSSI